MVLLDGESCCKDVDLASMEVEVGLAELVVCALFKNSPRWFSQQVVLRSFVFRGQRLPSAHLLSRTCEPVTSNKHAD